MLVVEMETLFLSFVVRVNRICQCVVWIRLRWTCFPVKDGVCV